MPKKNQATPELINNILALRKLGKGRNTICKELECSMSDVRYILEQNNMNAPENKKEAQYKQCIDCKSIKTIEEFKEYDIKQNGKKNGNKGRWLRCISCQTIFIRDEQARSYQKNREKRLLDAKEQRDRPENQERRREYEKAYSKKRKAEDPQYRLRHRFSSYIGSCLIRNDGNKWNESIMKYLDYSIEQLKAHLESQFEPWMSWENWGRYLVNEWDDARPETWKWQIDHIIPAISFTYDKMDHPEFKQCWGLHNLRPLSAKQNVIEGARKSNINE